MPNHQARRSPLPADYQYPTHGVDCDCPTCRNRVVGIAPCVCDECCTVMALGWRPLHWDDTRINH